MKTFEEFLAVLDSQHDAAEATLAQWIASGDLSSEKIIGYWDRLYGPRWKFHGYMHPTDHLAALRVVFQREPTLRQVYDSWVRFGPRYIREARDIQLAEGGAEEPAPLPSPPPQEHEPTPPQDQDNPDELERVMLLLEANGWTGRGKQAASEGLAQLIVALEDEVTDAQMKFGASPEPPDEIPAYLGQPVAQVIYDVLKNADNATMLFGERKSRVITRIRGVIEKRDRDASDTRAAAARLLAWIERYKKWRSA
mgnify:CR=1 FL=1